MSTNPHIQNPAWPELEAGNRLFGRYQLRERMAVGQRGELWKAWDEKLQATLALKLLPHFPLFAPMADKLGAIADLVHPNLVRTHGLAGDPQLCAVTMELVEGASLHELLNHAGGARTLETKDIHAWAVQLFAALQFVHGVGNIAHGDVRAANLLVTRDNTLKLAELYRAPTRKDEHPPTGAALASWSPQRLAGHPPTASDDLYAAGACLYEILTGQPVFSGDDIPQQIQNKVPPTVAERRRELGLAGSPVPPAWESLLQACLAKNPADRPADAGVVLSWLEALATNAAPKAAKPPVTGSRASWVATSLPTATAFTTRVNTWLDSMKYGRPIKFGALGLLLLLLVMGLYSVVRAPQKRALSERRVVYNALTEGDYSKGANPAERTAAWAKFAEYNRSRPIAFTSEDEAMSRDAEQRTQHWKTEQENLVRWAEEERRAAEKARADLAREMAAQKEADLATNANNVQRQIAWAKVLEKYGAAGHPGDDEYEQMLKDARATMDEWALREAEQQLVLEQSTLLAGNPPLQPGNTQVWLQGREKDLATIRAMGEDTPSSAYAKVNSLSAFLSSLDNPPADTGPRVAELREMADSHRRRLLAERDFSGPEKPLPVADLVAGTLVETEPAPLKRALVYKMQEQLEELDHYPSDPDGVHGPNSHKALVEFQTSRNLLPTGQLDPGTISALALNQVTREELVELSKNLGSDTPRKSTRKTTRKKQRKQEKKDPETFRNILRRLTGRETR